MISQDDSQIRGSDWPMPGWTAPGSPQHLPEFLDRPRSEEAVPRSASDSGPMAIPSQSALPLRVRQVAPVLGDRAPCRRRAVGMAPGAKVGAAVALAGGHELAALATAWNALAGPVPFRSFEWMESWWRHYQLPGWQTYLLQVEDCAGRIVGIAPWYLSRSRVAGRVVQFLGSGEVCSEYQTILAQPGLESAVAAALVRWLSSDGARDWDLLNLETPQANDATIAALADGFAALGHVVHQRPGMPCWRSELPDSWEEFVRKLSKSRRERLRQLTRKYFDPGRIRTRWVASEGELAPAFDLFVDLHQRRRRSLGQPGCYSSWRFAGFHREVSRRLCAQGKLRLLLTELDGRLIGAEYDFMDGRTVYYYSTGIDPDAAADHPGWLAMIGSLRLAIEDRCRGFDFLRGDEAYKNSWGAKPVATVETRIIARRHVARLRHCAWLGRQQLRRLAKIVRERFSK